MSFIHLTNCAFGDWKDVATDQGMLALTRRWKEQGIDSLREPPARV